MNSENNKATDNPYLDLRSQALSTTPEQLQVKIPSAQTKVIGMIVDWNLGGGSATFVSFSTGDASMYTSSGGGIIGGKAHENVRKASLRLVEKSQLFVGKAVRTDDTSFAKPNGVKFFFLTNHGRFVAEESMNNFDNGSSQWLALFSETNNLISELRSISADFENEQ